DCIEAAFRATRELRNGYCGHVRGRACNSGGVDALDDVVVSLAVKYRGVYISGLGDDRRVQLLIRSAAARRAIDVVADDRVRRTRGRIPGQTNFVGDIHAGP